MKKDTYSIVRFILIIILALCLSGCSSSSGSSSISTGAIKGHVYIHKDTNIRSLNAQLNQLYIGTPRGVDITQNYLDNFVFLTDGKATVTVSGPVTKSSKVANDGSFYIKGLKPGSYIITVSHPQFMAIKSSNSFIVRSGETTDIDSLVVLGSFKYLITVNDEDKRQFVERIYNNLSDKNYLAREVSYLPLASSSVIKNGISSLGMSSTPVDTFIFTFSGKAIYLNEEIHLCFNNSQDSISLNDIVNYVRDETFCRDLVMILDLELAGTTSLPDIKISTKNIAVTVISSVSNYHYINDSFTSNVVNCLNNPQFADINGDSIITLDELYIFLKDRKHINEKVNIGSHLPVEIVEATPFFMAR